jgi:hypothetical protein
VEVTETFHALLNKELNPAEASACLQECGLDAPFSNGFYHQQPGFEWLLQRIND